MIYYLFADFNLDRICVTLVFMKIMIFGRPGSGKSTFANQLGKSLGLPVYHLDKYFYVENWVERNYLEFLDIQQDLVSQDNWIIDGNATKSFEMRYVEADVAIYLLLPRYICFWRIFKRYWFKDEAIDDRAPECPERFSWKFLFYAWTFDKRVKAQIKFLQKYYPQVKFYKIQSDQQLLEIRKQLHGSN